MNLEYFLVLVALKNIHCYNPKGLKQSSTNVKNLKSSNSEPVIPARYKMASKTNYDSSILQNAPGDYFPEIEYPESIVDSSKPFYVSVSPFPDDVKSSFKSLSATGRSKPKSTIDYSWVPNENQSERSKEKLPSTSQNVDVNEITVTKGNDINLNDKGTNETLQENVTDVTDFYRTQNSDYNMNKLFTNWTSAEQSTEQPDYVLGYIIDMDEFMKNLTCLETKGFTEGNNLTAHTLGYECSKEFASAYSHINNDSIIEFNGNSFLTEADPERGLVQTFEESNLNDASSVCEVTKASFDDDMQGEFCNSGGTANETIN